MKSKILSTLICILMTIQIIPKGYSPHMITLFFNNYPEIQKDSFKPVSLNGKNPRAGIFASYHGYLATSDSAGEIMLPRKHQDTSFSLLICTDPEPVFMLENTIHHWQVKPTSATAFYTIERKQDDQTKFYFWNVKKDILPEDHHLPINTLIIFASPDEIYVPEGASITTKSPHLQLPDLYVKSSIKTDQNALSVIDLRTFFDPVNRSYKSGIKQNISHTNKV